MLVVLLKTHFDKMKKILYVALAVVTFTACTEDVTTVTPPETIEYTSGSADFTKFVAVGNSLTAGYSDAALFLEGQTNSFPNILATQFALAGGGEFTQPLVDDNLGGMTLGGTQILPNRMVLSFATGSPAPTVIAGTPTTEISNVKPGPYGNMGVPGAKSYHLVAPGYGNVAGVPLGLANPYYARMASSANATVIGDAAGYGASFFSLFIGNNDVLAYATSGGEGVDQTGNYNPATYGSKDITDPNVFAQIYNGLLQALTATGAKGVLANLPSVTTIPYFTTVPHNAIPLDAATAAMLNSAFAPYNGGLLQLQGFGLLSAAEVAKRTIAFTEGNNAVLILDEDLTDLTGINPALVNMRQATSDDLLVLPSRTFLGTTVGGNPGLINGVSVPLADKWVLTPNEQTTISVAQNQYNQTIAALAVQYDLAFVDIKAIFEEFVANGISQDGITTTATYATGGGFSLDGVHPSPRGYAILANAILDAVNAKYGSNLPQVKLIDYKGLYID